MADLVVIAPLTPLRIGDRYEQGKVPLHLTTLPKFQATQEVMHAVLAAIGEIAASTGPISVTTSGYSQFGHADNIPVTTVSLSTELRQLHLRLLEGAYGAGARPNHPDYNGDGYRPHITHTHDGHAVHPGSQVTLGSLAILDCSQPTRKISALWPLSDSYER